MMALLQPARWLQRAAALALAGVLAAALPGCGTPPPAPGVQAAPLPQDDAALRQSAQLAAAPAPRYLIAAGDELELRFPDQAQYDQVARVRPDGKVTLPLIGVVHVAGRTPEDVQQEAQERYRLLAGGTGEKSYLIRPNDELEIKFAYQPNLNEVVKVRPDGKIALQLAGTVLAQGLSPEELQAQLVKRYAKVLRAPELAVIMRSFNSQSVRVDGANGRMGRGGADYLQPIVALKTGAPLEVFVGGEVQRPGMLPFKPGMTLVQALMQAGGHLPTGELRAVTVLRKGTGAQPLVIRRDLKPDLTGQGTNDIALEASDVIVLPPNAAATLAQNLDQYVFKLIPPLRNMNFGFVYDLRGKRY